MTMTSGDSHETDKNIEIWKIKKLIKALEVARGNGTSMISLIIPPRDQISRITKMLGEEYGTTSNIKSRVNRQSVLSAITSAQQRLKLYNKLDIQVVPQAYIMLKFILVLPVLNKPKDLGAFSMVTKTSHATSQDIAKVVLQVWLVINYQVLSETKNQNGWHVCCEFLIKLEGGIEVFTVWFSHEESL